MSDEQEELNENQTKTEGRLTAMSCNCEERALQAAALKVTNRFRAVLPDS